MNSKRLNALALSLPLLLNACSGETEGSDSGSTGSTAAPTTGDEPTTGTTGDEPTTSGTDPTERPPLTDGTTAAPDTDTSTTVDPSTTTTDDATSTTVDPSDTNTSTTEPPPDPVCGNNVKEDGEACDGTDLGGATCVDLTGLDGDLECSADCTDFDVDKCVLECGNGVVNLGTEECDHLDCPPTEVCSNDGPNIGYCIAEVPCSNQNPCPADQGYECVEGQCVTETNCRIEYNLGDPKPPVQVCTIDCLLVGGDPLLPDNENLLSCEDQSPVWCSPPTPDQAVPNPSSRPANEQVKAKPPASIKGAIGFYRPDTFPSQPPALDGRYDYQVDSSNRAMFGTYTSSHNDSWCLSNAA